MFKRLSYLGSVLPILATVLSACDVGELGDPPAAAQPSAKAAFGSEPVPDDVRVDGGFFAAHLTGADCTGQDVVANGGDASYGGPLVVQIIAPTTDGRRSCRLTARYAVPARKYPSYTSATILGDLVGLGSTARSYLDLDVGGVAVSSSTALPANEGFVNGFADRTLSATETWCGARELTVLDVAASLGVELQRGTASEPIASIDGADVTLNLADCP